MNDDAKERKIDEITNFFRKTQWQDLDFTKIDCGDIVKNLPHANKLFITRVGPFWNPFCVIYTDKGRIGLFKYSMPSEFATKSGLFTIRIKITLRKSSVEKDGKILVSDTSGLLSKNIKWETTTGKAFIFDIPGIIHPTVKVKSNLGDDFISIRYITTSDYMKGPILRYEINLNPNYTNINDELIGVLAICFFYALNMLSTGAVVGA